MSVRTGGLLCLPLCLLSLTFDNVKAVSIRPLIMMDEADMNLVRVINDAVGELQKNESDLHIEAEFVFVDESHTSLQIKDQVCSKSADGSMWSGLVDLTWLGVSNSLHSEMIASSMPVTRIDLTNRLHVRLALDYLRQVNATDAVMVFQNKRDLNQSVVTLLGRSMIRLVLCHQFDQTTLKALKQVRPTPLNYVIFADGYNTNRYLWEADSHGLITQDSRWLLVLLNTDQSDMFRAFVSRATTVIASPQQHSCCPSITPPAVCNCLSQYNMLERAVYDGTTAIVQSYHQLGQSVGGAMSGLQCSSPVDGADNRASRLFRDKLTMEVSRVRHMTVSDDESGTQVVGPAHPYILQESVGGRTRDIAMWTAEEGLVFKADYQANRIRRHFRVGVIQANPWTFMQRDANGHPAIDNRGQPHYVGFCMDLLKEMAIRMQFDFELVFPSDGAYGVRDPHTGQWNGLIGQLARKETDMIIAPLSMTSEREEVVDFVAPYFDQSGISIVVRQREPDTSLFRFLSVLRLEVWISLVVALALTGFMIWLLDTFSPYSGQNSADHSPHKYRKFTIKESFWFALTSFTPQGGGEAPRALSGRTLVAAYWLFVVLMLATFTANLAAFLTVERLQTTVKDLDELGKQSRISFTVVANTSVESYFSNMAFAERALFKVWKEMTLGATTDQARYRVWDYPIKEQYTHLFDVIRRTGMMSNESVGFDQVREDKSGSFALILDSSMVRYEVNQDCNLTQIGQPFAQRPYAIAVQEGSRLKHEISRIILDLQNARFFDLLTASYWNSTYRSQCPSRGDSEGITLQSLGGVFIATMAGLFLALVALVIEVIYYRNKAQRQLAPETSTNQVEAISAGNGADQKNYGTPFRGSQQAFE